MGYISNTTIGMAFLLFAALALPATITSIIRKRERDASFFFVLLGLSNAIWGLFTALFYLLPDERAALLFFDLRVPFICYSNILIYLFTLKSFRHISIPRTALITIFMIPVITAALILIGDMHQLLRIHIEIVVVDGIRTVSKIDGPWFYMHCLVALAAALMALRLMMRQLCRLPDHYRTSVIIMLCAMIMFGISMALGLFGMIPYSIDAAAAVVQVSQILFFLSLFNPHSLDDLFTARDAVFTNESNPIFILSLNGRVVDYNKKAGEIGDSLAVGDIYDMPFDCLLQKWISHYSAHRLREDDSILTINLAGADIHYQIIRSKFMNSKGGVAGSLVEFKNITPIMTLIHTLQDFAYYDQLTGLLNRRSFAQKLIDYDAPQYLPVGLVVGDVNNLKRVNDNYGHATGDILLYLITDILKGESPKQADWFRVGGDEFIAIIPNTTGRDMQALLEAVQARCEALGDPRFANSGIALAFRMRENMDENMSALLADADRAMYADKWNRRKLPQQTQNAILK